MCGEYMFMPLHLIKGFEFRAPNFLIFYKLCNIKVESINLFISKTFFFIKTLLQKQSHYRFH